MFGSPAAEHYELTVCCSLHGQESVLIHVSNHKSDNHADSVFPAQDHSHMLFADAPVVGFI